MLSTDMMLQVFFILGCLCTITTVASPISDADAWHDHTLQNANWGLVRHLAEKRHLLSLLPYHPVVRFRGLGGPGDTWNENGPESSLEVPYLAGPSHLEASAQHHVRELPPLLEGQTTEDMNAVDLLNLLESMVGIHEDEAPRVIKSVRFGRDDAAAN